jgi:hypothetical protein
MFQFFSEAMNVTMTDKSDKPTTVSESVAKQIDENLQRLYAPGSKEDIPEHLQALLRQLREKDGAP